MSSWCSFPRITLYMSHLWMLTCSQRNVSVVTQKQTFILVVRLRIKQCNLGLQKEIGNKNLSNLQWKFHLHNIKTWINWESELWDNPKDIQYVMLRTGFLWMEWLESKIRVTMKMMNRFFPCPQAVSIPITFKTLCLPTRLIYTGDI